MAFDGLFLDKIKHEIETLSLDGRVDKIHQPSREVLVMTIRGRSGSHKLLISAAASSPRIHYTQVAVENPKSPPMFCALMRKHLSSGRLVGIRQVELDRILHLDFETLNEFGDRVVITLSAEIMSRHSNIILTDHTGRIIDAIKRIDPDMSSVRPILPGMMYTLPPQQNKLNLLETTPEAVLAGISAGRDVPLSKGLMDCLQGVSPLICRELSAYAARELDTVRSQLSPEQLARLRFILAQLIDTVRQAAGTPTMLLDMDMRPRDFSFMPIRQYGHSMVTKEFASYSVMLDSFYGERDRMERMKQRSGDMLRQIVNLSDRTMRRLQSQREELRQSNERGRLKEYGDLISANLYNLRRGDCAAVVQNFYDEGFSEIEIPLDPRLTPVQNAQKYYASYRKADTAQKKLTELVRQGEIEYEYIDTIFDALSRASTEAELEAIREEVAMGGYIRLPKGRDTTKSRRLAPLEYRSTDGFTILCGRNNLQNDKLTIKDSKGSDLWLHVQKIPGSHVIIAAQGNEIPAATIEQAAVIAAYHSKARESCKVPVDYTPVRYVKKPNGAKPGYVIYETYQTAIVNPDPQLVTSLLQ